jgi:hypothetical protein
MPTPGLQKLERSFKAIRIGAVHDMQRIQKRAEEDGLIERDEQFQIAVSGLAEEFFKWSVADIKFTTVFVDATGQRDSPFDRPHISVGSELYTPVPVALQAVVLEWKINERNETLGAKVAIGVSSTDLPTKFRGSVHLTFQGYGQPLNTFNDEELTT